MECFIIRRFQHGGYHSVTGNDATRPYNGEKKYDVVVANPPFGTTAPITRDGVTFTKLEHVIAINALDAMKDDGRAAIIVGGETEYDNHGLIKGRADLDFYRWLYDHYNVKGVVEMDGELYANQGTTYPTRMILIEGRRSEEERSKEKVTPPTKEQAPRKAETYRDLYNIVEELKKNKTNGNVLRRRESELPDAESGTDTKPKPGGGARPRPGDGKPAGDGPGTGAAGGTGETKPGGAEETGGGGPVDGVSPAGGDTGPSGQLGGTETGTPPHAGGSDVGKGGGTGDAGGGPEVPGGGRELGGTDGRPGDSGVGLSEETPPKEPEKKRTLKDTHVPYSNVGRGSVDCIQPHKGDVNIWYFDTDVYQMEGVGRFYIGLANHIRILDAPKLEVYVREFCEKWLKGRS